MGSERKSLITDEQVAEFLQWLSKNAQPLPPRRPEKLEAIKEEYKQVREEKVNKENRDVN